MPWQGAWRVWSDSRGGLLSPGVFRARFWEIVEDLIGSCGMPWAEENRSRTDECWSMRPIQLTVVRQNLTTPNHPRRQSTIAKPHKKSSSTRDRRQRVQLIEATTRGLRCICEPTPRRGGTRHLILTVCTDSQCPADVDATGLTEALSRPAAALPHSWRRPAWIAPGKLNSFVDAGSPDGGRGKVEQLVRC